MRTFSPRAHEWFGLVCVKSQRFQAQMRHPELQPDNIYNERNLAAAGHCTYWYDVPWMYVFRYLLPRMQVFCAFQPVIGFDKLLSSELNAAHGIPGCPKTQEFAAWAKPPVCMQFTLAPIYLLLKQNFTWFVLDSIRRHSCPLAGVGCYLCDFYFFLFLLH